MTFVALSRSVLLSFLLFTLLTGCVAPHRGPVEPPPFSDTWMNSRWGDSIEDVKKAIERDGSKLFEDSIEKPPYALYASGTFLEHPATLSYFFTPKSKKLYRVDVTYKDAGIYEKVRGALIQKFTGPTYSQKDVDHWSWRDDSLVILQRGPSNVQVSYSRGPFSKLNHQEGNGLLGR